MPPKKIKPTVEEVLELYDETKRVYETSGLWSQWDEDEQFYELDVADRLLLPKEFKAEGIILPTGRDIVDACSDQTSIDNVRVWVNRKGESPKSDKQANMMRKFGLGVLYRNNVEAPVAPLRVAAKHYWLHGLAILKTIWDADRMMDKPDQKSNESEDAYATRIDEWRASDGDSIPIVLLAVHPRNVMFDPFHESNGYAFEVREELCFNVRQKFPKWSNPHSKKVTDKIEHTSFWTPFYRCELYDREPVMHRGGGVVEHSYGMIPYIPIETGLGNLTSDNDLKKRYVGVLRYIKDLLLSESRDYSIGDVILKRTAFPWGYLKGANAAQVQQVFQKFGEYNTLPEGVDIVDMAPKVPPEALLVWLSTAASYLASHATPNVVRGMGEQGVRSGVDRRLMLAQATTRYLYSNEAFQHGVAKALSNCARIMKNVVPGNIRVWSRTPTDEFDIEIDKAQMQEPFTFYVEFSPISEEDEYRRHDDLERLYKSGLTSKNWARKQMSNVDPDALELEEEIEKLKDDPLIRQMISQYAAGKLAQELGRRSILEPGGTVMPQGSWLAPNATTPEQPQEPGRQVMPPVPNVAPLRSAEETQNRLKNLRSRTSMNPMQGIGGGGNR